MALKSMTGFARADGTLGEVRWHWEVRSVNNRGLDLRLRLPPGTEALEPAVREKVAKRVTRGSLTVNLRTERETRPTEIRLNEAALAQAIAAAERIRQLTNSESPRAEGLLGLKGVLEVIEAPEDEAETVRLNAAMLTSLETALEGMIAARTAEGSRLNAVLEAQLRDVEDLVARVENAPGRRPEAIKTRLKEMVAKLLDSGNGFDEARLHQEAVMLATRADVEEELKRLTAHLAAARELLSADGTVGRKFDFLAQELNREANTLTSKAIDAEISRHGLNMKVIIDQLREQVQNIE